MFDFVTMKLHHIFPTALLAMSACNLLGTTDWCDPTSPLYPHLSPDDLAKCEQSETGGEQGPYTAWCVRDIEDFDGEPMRHWCYPTLPRNQNPAFYKKVDCAAVFDYDSWNYDGSCHPDNNCNESPTIKGRFCFDAEHADQVAGKMPADQSIRTCWEDAWANGEAYPTLYLAYEYLDDKLLSPLCDPQDEVEELGPTCTFSQGVVCLSHDMFCACKCASDADCEAPSVCEGYYPGQPTPSFCVYPEN